MGVYEVEEMGSAMMRGYTGSKERKEEEGVEEEEVDGEGEEEAEAECGKGCEVEAGVEVEVEAVRWCRRRSRVSFSACRAACAESSSDIEGKGGEREDEAEGQASEAQAAKRVIGGMAAWWWRASGWKRVTVLVMQLCACDVLCCAVSLMRWRLKRWLG